MQNNDQKVIKAIDEENVLAFQSCITIRLKLNVNNIIVFADEENAKKNILSLTSSLLSSCTGGLICLFNDAMSDVLVSGCS